MYTENASKAHGKGILNLTTFEPFPKNPAISKVFRETSLADELGSGMRNTYKYTQLYSGRTSELIEGNVFKTTVPLDPVSVGKVGPTTNILVTDQDSDQDSDQDKAVDVAQQILAFCNVERGKQEICSHLGYRNLTFFTRKYLTPLLQSGQLLMTLPDKPRSKNKKYITAKEK